MAVHAKTHTLHQTTQTEVDVEILFQVKRQFRNNVWGRNGWNKEPSVMFEKIKKPFEDLLKFNWIVQELKKLNTRWFRFMWWSFSAGRLRKLSKHENKNSCFIEWRASFCSRFPETKQKSGHVFLVKNCF